jgi:hypothetical protein
MMRAESMALEGMTFDAVQMAFDGIIPFIDDAATSAPVGAGVWALVAAVAVVTPHADQATPVAYASQTEAIAMAETQSPLASVAQQLEPTAQLAALPVAPQHDTTSPIAKVEPVDNVTACVEIIE